MKEIAIIGGGLSGLISAIELSREGFEIILFEKKRYPFHRVCGEYISYEVEPYLRRKGLMPETDTMSSIQRFELTSIKGKSLNMNLDLGGFGVSRFLLDNHLAKIARESGVVIQEQTSVIQCDFVNNHFHLGTSNGKEIKAKLVIGAFGKNSIIDKKLNRKFTKIRSPYLGVKYHIKTNFPRDKISLHNFEGGYCGINAIEDGKFNLCYLASRDILKQCGSIEEMEEKVLSKNQYLKQIFENSDFLFERPEVINEFSFAPKKLIENHILMTGDAAGLITPLCGNGMAMAIHSGKILSDLITYHFQNNQPNRAALEDDYLKSWNTLFKKRLWVGRQTQKLFGSKFTSELTVQLMNSIPGLARSIMKNTHGEPF